MKQLLFLVFSILSFAGFSQDPIADLQQQAKTATDKASIYNEIIMHLKNADFQTAKPFIDSAMTFAKKEHNDTAWAIAQSFLAHYYENKQQHKKSYSILHRIIPKLSSLQNHRPLLDAYSDLGTICFYRAEYDSAIYYFKKSIPKDNDSAAAISLNNIAVTYYYTEQYDSSIIYNEKALAIKKKFHNYKGIAYSLNNIANIYDLKGDYETSSKYYYKALQYCDKTHALKLKSTILNNIAGLYKLWNEYDKALELYQNALALKKSLNDSLGQANVESNIGSIYSLKKQYDVAERYHKHAKAIYTKLDNKHGLSVCYNNLGVVYEKKGELYNAVLYYKLSKKIVKSAKGEANANLNIGHTFLLMKRLDTAEHYLVASLEQAQTHHFRKLLQKIYFNLANLYEQEDNINMAYSYLKLYYTLKDSSASTERYKQITELESKYKTKQQQQEIKNLSQQKKIATQKLEIQALQLKKNRWAIIFLTFSIIAGILLFGLWYRQKVFKERHRAIELEQKLLRLQMNPHFISNALTSIQQFVLTNNPMEAARYLARFSDMMRNIIESSREEFIPLSKEYETISHYLALQHLRFDNLFDYDIKIDSQLDIDNVLIPPMLAQPIIENAIRHAFVNLSYKGHIEIIFRPMEHRQLEFTIRDNGVGFPSMPDITSDSAHTSYSLQIIKERIRNLNKRHKGHYFFEIRNRQETEQKNGTFARFILPLNRL